MIRSMNPSTKLYVKTSRSIASLEIVQNYGHLILLSALIYFRDSCGIIAYAARAFETGTFQCTDGN